MNDTTKLVGRLVEGMPGRDAIHVAVVPVTNASGMVLRPGDHVDRDGCHARERVGVVDPFLTAPVRPGERFWLFLYPATITSLRHVWTHPAFETKLPPVKTEGAA